MTEVVDTLKFSPTVVLETVWKMIEINGGDLVYSFGRFLNIWLIAHVLTDRGTFWWTDWQWQIQIVSGFIELESLKFLQNLNC